MITDDSIPNLPSSNQYYLRTSLYNFYEIEDSDKEQIHKLVFSQDTIDCYCRECKADSVFLPINNFPVGTYGRLTQPHQWAIDFKNDHSIFNKEFRCSRNSDHKLLFITQIKDSKIGKIGQYPSIADLEEGNIRKFRKVLTPHQYKEFNKAIGLFAHGVGVGSYVYLRRLVELYVVKPAYEIAKLSSGWDEEAYAKSKFKEKVGILKEYLPDFLKSNPALYSVISKGIHDLTEEECLQYFPVVKSCLEIIFIEIKANKEEKLARENAAAELSKIAGSLPK